MESPASAGQPWFSRSKVAPELEDNVFSSGRKMFYDSNGEDLRLKEPGFNWSYVCEKRHHVLDDCKQQLTNMFDQFYEKITGQRNNRDKRKSSIMPILPSMKTPGLSRHRSRIAKVDEVNHNQPSKEIETDFAVNVLSPPFPSEQQAITLCTTRNNIARTESVEQSHDCPPLNLKAADTVVQGEMKQVEIVDVAIADVTNVQRSTRASTVRKTTATRGKPGHGGVKQNNRLNKRNIECESEEENRQSNKPFTLSSDDDFVLEIPRQKSKRLTKRLNDISSSSVKGIAAAPRRVTRSRVCKSSNKKDSAVVVQEDLTTDSESIVLVRSSTVGVDSEEPLKVKNNKILKKLSVSNRNSGSICRVSVVRLSTPTPENVQAGTEIEKLIDVHVDKEPMEDNLSDELASGISSHDLPSVVELNTDKDLQNDPTMNPTASTVRKVEALTSSSTDTESDTEVALARPTPPRSNLLKLKKKGGKRGGKGRTAKLKTRAAMLKGKVNTSEVETDTLKNVGVFNSTPPRPATDVPHPISTVVSSDDSVDTSSPVVPMVTPSSPQPPVNAVVAPTLSSESLYESCVSEMDTPPVVSKQNILLPNCGVTVTKSSTTTFSTPSICTPCNGETTYLVSENTPLCSPSPPHTKPDPVSISHLSGTIQKLQEEHRARTGGKLVSLSDLLSSGGRSSPSLKKTSRIPRGTETTTKGMPSFHTSKTPLLTKTTTKIPKLTIDTIIRGKRLRSVSLEKLTDLEENGSCHKRSRSRTSSAETSEEDGSSDLQNGTETDSPDTDPGMELEDNPNPCSADTPPQKSNKPKSFFFGFFGKKPANDSKITSGQEGGNVLTSFIPQRTPKKAETFQSRQAQLAEKILRREEEEEKRKEDLRNKKQNEILEKIKKREDKARRVAEKQAALRLEEEEKKLKIKGHQSRDQQKKVTQKKAKEMEYKNKKLKERMMAAEGRRKQGDIQQQQRLQQLEEERRMVSELAVKRKELEEEEKRSKRQEKQKLDKERQQKREEEMREKHKQQSDDQKQQQAEASKKVPVEAPPKRHKDLMKQFEQLLGGALAKVPVVATPKVNRVLSSKEKTGGGETNKFMQAFYSQLHGQPQATSHSGGKPTKVLGSAESKLNTTFTKDSETIPDVLYKTPVSGSGGTKGPPTSYEMTPAENDPLFAYDNYDIGNLSSEDSTDDEDCPKKVLPNWARPDSLNTFMRSQEDDINQNRVDISKIFPPEQLLKDPNLAKIFRHRRQRFFQRSSSAHWDSPMMKRSKLI